MIPPNEYWGYLHQNGSIQVKRYFGDIKDYTEDCENNPFVIKVVEPFQADSIEEARKILEQKLRNYDYFRKIKGTI